MIRVKLLNDNAKIPTRGSEFAAGLDLYAPESFTLYRGETKKIPLGIAFGLEVGTFGKITERSSYAFFGLHVIGGVIDADYTGEVSVVLYNGGDRDREIAKHDRIAQLIIVRCDLSTPQLVTELQETERGKQGFGSTGR